MSRVERDGDPIRVGAFVLTPIERTLVDGHLGEGGFVVLASKRPIALRIAAPDGSERVVPLDDG